MCSIPVCIADLLTLWTHTWETTGPQQLPCAWSIKKEHTSHSQVRYIFDLQRTYTVWCCNADTVISVSATFHGQGRVFQYAVNRRDCCSVNYLRDGQFVCVTRANKFFWMNDLLVWGWAELNNLTLWGGVVVTKLTWILSHGYAKLIFIQMWIFGHDIFWKKPSLPNVNKYCLRWCFVKNPKPFTCVCLLETVPHNYR